MLGSSLGTGVAVVSEVESVLWLLASLEASDSSLVSVELAAAELSASSFASSYGASSSAFVASELAVGDGVGVSVDSDAASPT